MSSLQCFLHTRTHAQLSYTRMLTHAFACLFTQLHRYTHTFTLAPALTLTCTNILMSHFLCFRRGFLIISKGNLSCRRSGERKDEDEAEKVENLPDLQGLDSQVLGRTGKSQVRHLRPGTGKGSPRSFSRRTVSPPPFPYLCYQITPCTRKATFIPSICKSNRHAIHLKLIQ